MANTLNSFFTGQVGTSATDLTNTSSAEKKFIGQLSFVNTSAAAVLVYVHKLDTTGTETTGSGGNWLVRRSIQPGKIWNVIDEVGTIVLKESQTLSAQAATGSVINAECGGVIES